MRVSGRGGGGVYRPELDGLRAVAVYLVVAFHGGSGWLSGGFVGVDVFFVLSGFLVTQLLLRDVVGSGRVGLGRFYARRFRRLLPAAFVVLVVSGLVFSALASPVEVADAVGGFRAAFLYVTNWFFIRESADYFGADLGTNPVLHFWSLAVEEQFYLVWPLLLGGLWAVAGRFGRGRWRVVRGVVAAGAVVSLVWAWSLRGSDPIRAYYGTDARAYQLMAGALLALTPGLVGRLGVRFAGVARWVGLVGLVGLVGAASSWVEVDAIERGIVVTVVTVVVLVCLEAGAGGPLWWGLSRDPVVYLGKVSYGTYLWHWPVILVIDRSFDLSPVTTIGVTVLVATALASLSFQLLEHPIRVSGFLDRYRAPVIASGLALSVFSALVIIPAIVEPSPTAAAPSPGSPATTGFTPVPPGLDFTAIKTDVVPFTSCLDQPVSACTIVEGTGAHLLLIGDSHAAMMIPTFRAIAQQHDLTLSVSVKPGCAWQRGIYRVPDGLVGLAPAFEDCKGEKDDLYDRVIPALDPDIIITGAVDYLARGVSHVFTDDGRLQTDSPEYGRYLEQTTVRSLAEVGGDRRKVLLIEPIPVSEQGFDPIACLSEASVVEACRYVASTEPSALELLYRRLDAESDRVWSADLDRLVCPFLPICDPVVGGIVVQVDGSHLAPSFAVGLASSMTEYLELNGILAG